MRKNKIVGAVLGLGLLAAFAFAQSRIAVHEHIEFKRGLVPVVLTTGTINGPSVDKEDFRSAMVACDIAPLGGTSPVIDIKVQDAPDVAGSPGTFADVTGAVFTQFTATRDDGIFYGTLNLNNRRQWLRVVAVGGGSTQTGSYTCGWILTEARDKPNTQAVARDFFVN